MKSSRRRRGCECVVSCFLGGDLEINKRESPNSSYTSKKYISFFHSVQARWPLRILLLESLSCSLMSLHFFSRDRSPIYVTSSPTKKDPLDGWRNHQTYIYHLQPNVEHWKIDNNDGAFAFLFRSKRHRSIDKALINQVVICFEW